MNVIERIKKVLNWL